MRHTMRSSDKEAIECSECGKGGGFESDSGVHCAECGRFATVIDGFCTRHGVDYSRLTGYNQCPRCRQEQSVQQQRQERQARRADPSMHPTVDARRF
jgi:anaerobic ribonucleoside-triphosphate reductase